MSYFLHTIETIPDGVGFRPFGLLHISWLLLGLIIISLNSLWYLRLSDCGRTRWRKTVAVLIVLDEAFKVIMLLIGGRYTAEYLPLHLCSINIILIAIHAWKPSSLLSGFLYTVCIPGAISALLFPTWTSLPIGNFMHLHSFTVHILLVLYPVVLFISGELAPSIRKLYKYLLLLVAMAAVVYVINILLDTNFMFLMYAKEDNPLYLFQRIWGSHLYGFPVLLFAVLLVMYAPLTLYRIKKKRPI